MAHHPITSVMNLKGIVSNLIPSKFWERKIYAKTKNELQENGPNGDKAENLLNPHLFTEPAKFTNHKILKKFPHKQKQFTGPE